MYIQETTGYKYVDLQTCSYSEMVRVLDNKIVGFRDNLIQMLDEVRGKKQDGLNVGCDNGIVYRQFDKYDNGNVGNFGYVDGYINRGGIDLYTTVTATDTNVTAYNKSEPANLVVVKDNCDVYKDGNDVVVARSQDVGTNGGNVVTTTTSDANVVNTVRTFNVNNVNTGNSGQDKNNKKPPMDIDNKCVELKHRIKMLNDMHLQLEKIYMDGVCN